MQISKYHRKFTPPACYATLKGLPMGAQQANKKKKKKKDERLLWSNL